MMRNRHIVNLVFYLILVAIFAYDMFTVDSWGIKVIRGILMLFCMLVCYGEYKTIKEKK